LICLSFWQGGEQKHYTLGYITENLPTHYQVTIRDHDVSMMENDPVYQTLDEPIVRHPLAVGKQCIASYRS